MMLKQWALLSIVILFFFTVVVHLKKSVIAACIYTCNARNVCTQICSPTAAPTSPPQSTTAPSCSPLKLKCSTACGLAGSCKSDGCGGQVCCPATAACTPTAAGTSTTVCNTDFCGSTGCMVTCCTTVRTGTSSTTTCRSAVGPTPTNNPNAPSPTRIPTPLIQNTVIPTSTVVPTLVPTLIPTPQNTCSLRPQGDANCNNIVDSADFEIFKLMMNGQTPANSMHSADFSGDGKVSVVDYEIWRNTVYK